MKPQTRPATIATPLLSLLLLAGCAVPSHRQRLVSKPSMQFSDSAVHSDRPRVALQIESGASGAAAGLAAGCSSCR